MPELDGEGKLAADVHCRRCGYNLRGLEPSGTCPECDLPASRSIHGDWLKFSEPEWVKRLHQGTHLLLGGIVAGFVVGIVTTVLLIVIGPSAMAFALMMLAFGVIGIIWVAGVWYLTTPDPGAEQIERGFSARRVARWCSVASMASMPLAMYQQQGVTLTAPVAASTMLDALLLVASGVLSIITIMGMAGLVVHLQGLALRIPLPGLAKQTRIAGWGYVATSIVGQINGFIFQLIGMAGLMTPNAAAPMMLFAFGSCAIGIASLVFGIWSLVVLVRFAKAFADARDEAQALSTEVTV